MRTENEVIFIDRKKKTVTVRLKSEDTYEESYDKLLISTGASPVRPPLPGIDSTGIFTLRNVADTDRIKAYVNNRPPRRAVVIGAGFIGLEMAENLHALGAQVSIVEMGNQVMAPIDFSMAALVHQHLMEKGVNLYLEQAVASFEQAGKEVKVVFKNGQSILADIVILSIGVRPETTLARAAELTIGEAGGIAVNDYLQTSDESIYAIGDAIEFRHPITGKPWLNYLAGPANRQGRIVADNLLGAQIPYEGAIDTSIAKVFDMTVASTGLPGKRLKQAGIVYASSTTHPASHAGYYPDAMPMSIKITFDPQTGKLYGGQIVGYDGVDKRIDELSLVIKHEGTIYDLMKVEQAYAPPFSSAKDPVAIAGYVAENIILGRVKPVYWRDLRDIELKDVFLLDVRTPDEFALGSLPGAVNIPLDEIRDRIAELPSNKPIYTFCAVGLRGYLAYRILIQHGFKEVYNLSGGLKTYRAATAPIILHENEETDDTPSAQDSPAKPSVVDFDASKYTLEYDKLPVMDKWLLSKLNSTVAEVDSNLDQYRIPEAAKALQDFVDEMSNWYVRRSRERFWAKGMEQDKINAYMTLYTALVTICKAAAPMIPFMTEDIYQNLVRSNDASAPESIHLCDFPVVNKDHIDKKLEEDMEDVLDAVVMGRACRNEAAIKNRQPISRMYIKADFTLSEFYQEIIEDELNVKEVVFTDDVRDFTSYTFKPQLRTVGPKYGKQLGGIQKHLAALDGNAAMDELNADGALKFDVDGVAVELTKDDLLIDMAQKEGYVSQEDNRMTVVLDTNLTPELVEEGFVYEIISKIQTMRKESGFEVTDHIRVSINGNDRLSEIARKNKDAISGKVLADELTSGAEYAVSKEWNINGENAVIAVERV